MIKLTHNTRFVNRCEVQQKTIMFYYKIFKTLLYLKILIIYVNKIILPNYSNILYTSDRGRVSFKTKLAYKNTFIYLSLYHKIEYDFANPDRIRILHIINK